MKIVHAVLQTQEQLSGEAPLFVWMEPGNRSGKLSRLRTEHPYALDSTQTEAELKQWLDANLACYKARCRLLLPAHSAEPHLSTEASEEVLPLRLWVVDGVWVHTRSLLTFMAVAEKWPADHDVLHISPELVALARYTRWVLRQVDRRRVIPDLVYEGRPSYARWRLTRTPAMWERLEGIASAFPRAALAAVPATQPTVGTERITPSQALLAYADLVVDLAVRERLVAKGPVRPASTSRLVERWVAALQTPDGRVYASTALQQLAESIADWHEEGIRAEALQRPLRLVLQLAPIMPVNKGDELATPTAWRLHYAGHDPDRPAEAIPAEQLWSDPDEGYAVTLRRHLERAARIFSPIGPTLINEEPIGCELTPDEAANFVYQAADRLAEEGVLIQLPAWMERRPEPLRTRLVVEPGSGVLSLDTLVAYEWQAAIGDRDIAPEEFARLTQARLPFVRLGDEWIALPPDELRRLIERARRAGPGGRGEASVADLAWEPLEGDVELELRAGDNMDRLERLLSALGRERRWELVEPPRGLRAELRPYQQRGFSWLLFMRHFGLGACLADDMGLGKTLQVIALFQHEKEQKRMVGTALVVCPTSVVENWRRELERFAPELRVYVHHGQDRKRGAEFEEEARSVDVVLTSYGLVVRDVETLSEIAWDTVVVDEAQNLKNPTTKQTRGLKKLQATHRIALTGTPVENRLTELWSIFDFLIPGYLGGLTEFKREIAGPIERHGDQDMLAYLQRRIHPLILRRSKDDPAIAPELPEKLESKVYCTLTTEQAALYQAVVERMLHRIEEASGMKRRGLVLASLTRLKQICDHPALFLKQDAFQVHRSGKLRELLARVRELREQGECALIFTQYAQMGRILQRTLAKELGIEVLFLHGGVPRHKRDEQVARFQRGDVPLFVLSLRAGGVGLNLTRATHVFHFDRWWNPAVENQATDRAYRIGQERQVNVYKFICTGTLEDHIDRLIEAKRSLADNVIHSGETWLSELSNEELRELFTLTR